MMQNKLPYCYRQRYKTKCNVANLVFPLCLESISTMGFNTEKFAQIPNNLMCNYCGNMYSPKGLKEHAKIVHGVNMYKGNMNCAETGCEEKFSKRTQLIAHLKKKHSMQFEIYDMQFNCIEEFQKWMEEEEVSTLSKYIRKWGEKKTINGSTFTLLCCRDGEANTLMPSARKRALKAQGSRKCGNTCVSHLVVNKLLNPTPNIIVRYYKTHYAHIQEVQHISIAKTDKDVLASQLAIGVTENRIIKDAIENSLCKPSATRMDTVTRQDLANIRASYGISIDGGRRESNEMISLDMLKEANRERFKKLLARLVEFENSNMFDTLPVGKQNEIIRYMSSTDLLMRNLVSVI